MKCDGNEIQVEKLSSLINSFKTFCVIYSLDEVDQTVKSLKYGVAFQGRGPNHVMKNAAKPRYGLKSLMHILNVR